MIRFDNVIEKKIPNFSRTLTIDAERSGLFNLAMNGLDRLINQSQFSYDKSALDIKKEMMRSSSSIAQFAAEMCVQENGSEISKEALFEIYSQFCADRGLAAETIKKFGTRLLLYVPYVTDGLITDMSGKRPRGWRNVGVKQEADGRTFEDFETRVDI